MHFIILLFAVCAPFYFASASSVVDIQVYRHGFSCSNFVGDCTKCSEVKALVNDGLLTGVSLATGTGKNGIPKPDVVFSSTLVRAMETALYQFPGMTIYPVPFVKEASSDPPDLPQSVADQKKVITAMDGAAAAARVNNTYTTPEACVRGSTSPRCRASWPNFLTWLEETLANDPPSEVAAKLEAGEPISIAIITHGLLIKRQIIERPADDVYNDQGFSGTFTFYPETGELTQDGEWADIPQAPGNKKPCDAEAGLPPADYARCEKRYPQAWAQLRTKSCVYDL